MEETRKPLLALDVDGPIVIFGEHEADEVMELWAGEVPSTISRDLPKRLSVLIKAFRIVWYTSWEKSASFVLASLVGLPEGPPWVPLDAERPNPGDSRKFPALKAWQGLGGPLAVVDDEIGYDMVDWAKRRAEPTLLLEIDPRLGLQDQHVQELLEFARETSGAAS